MKKFALGLMAASALLLSSCNMGGGDNYQNVGYYPSNLIIPADGSEPVMSQGAYLIKFDFNNSTATVSSSALKVNNKDYNFALDPVSYTDYGYKQVIKGTTGIVTGTGMEVKNTFFMISAYDALPKDFNPLKVFTPTIKDKDGKTTYLPGTLIAPVVNSVSALFVGYYQMGSDYTVHTFSSDAFYSGKTDTGLATSDKTVYRVIMDIEKKKATLVIYDAKFAEAMPNIPTIILPDLDVKINGNGYEVAGKNIIPLIPEANSTMANLSECTPNEKYVFNSFSMITRDKYLTSVEMRYNVASKFNGYFTGSYVKLPEDKEK